MSAIRSISRYRARVILLASSTQGRFTQMEILMRLSVIGFAICTALLSGAVGATSQVQAVPGVRPMLMPECGSDEGPGPDPDDARTLQATTSGRPTSAAMHAAAAAIGTTRDDIKSKFASNIEVNFERAPETLLSRLSDKELAAIFRHYGETKSLAGSRLMQTLASRTSATSLVRLRTLAGEQVVDDAVKTYADQAVSAEYASASTVRPYISKVTPMAGPAPTLDMTIEEIYLEFRTAPVGSVGPAAAIAETTMYVGLNVTAAWTAGNYVGEHVNGLIDQYDPSLGDAIGGTVAGMVDASHAAVDDISKGHFESAYDDLFGFPVTDANQGGADYDVAAPMVDYYDAGGGCGM